MISKAIIHCTKINVKNELFHKLSIYTQHSTHVTHDVIEKKFTSLIHKHT